MRKWRPTLLFLLLCCSLQVASQQFGGNPPSLKWKQINNDTARIIFPQGLEMQAMNITSLVNKMATITQRTIGNRLGKVNIVLQNQPTISNGYVSMGPFRSEFFMTPRQNSFELGSLPWHKTLALHEYRHVQQYNNFRKGLSRAFYYVFGQEGQSFANSLAIPDWFWEGDAVFQETVLSNQGRGRLPFFFNTYRSLWASGKNYSWMKLRNGSYRDQMPDHYQLGYMLVAYGYEKYGENIWKEITGDAAAFKSLIYPFQKAVKRRTGESFHKFTNDAFDYFKNHSKNFSTDTVARYGMRQPHFVSDDQFPAWVDSTRIIFLKTTYTHIPAFFIKNVVTGDEKRIAQKAISTDDYFSYRNGKIIYSAYQPDKRWGWKNFEVIRILDIKTRKEKSITHRTRYFSPDISDDGKQIVAVHSDITGKNELHVLNADNGKLISSLPNPNQYVFTYPKFYKPGKIVSAVRNKAGEMALGIFDVNTNEVQWLKQFSINVIGFPQVNGDTVSFTMSMGSQDRLFAAVPGKLLQFHPSLTNQHTGNYQLAMLNGQYAWTSYSAAGTKLFHAGGQFEHISDTIRRENNFYPLQRVQYDYNLARDTAIINQPITKYSTSFNIFNFHSWRPYISDPDYSYSLIGENVLNTLRSELFFNYNRNENFKEIGGKIAYAGWFPVIQGGASFTLDRFFRDTATIIQWDEFTAEAGAEIPLAFTNGTYNRNIDLGATFNTKQVYFKGASKESFNDRTINFMEWSAAFTNQQLRARQHIYPKFAQTIFSRYRHIINKYSGYQLLLNTSLYFPGFFTNHSIVLQAAYQQRDTLQEYTFSNSFPISRGYSNLDFPKMWKLGINYHFPIAYPEIGGANIVYLMRMRGNIFYDYTRTKSVRTTMEFPFSTAGGELYFDTKWWNQLPVSVGIRYSRLLNRDIAGISQNQWEIVLPVNLLSR